MNLFGREDQLTFRVPRQGCGEEDRQAERRRMAAVYQAQASRTSRLGETPPKLVGYFKR